MGTYKTEGRQRLLSFLLDHPDRQYTVDEIRQALNERGESAGDTARKTAGKSSLYRQLSELCEDGTVRKFRTDTQSSFVYQLIGHTDCQHHFHLKCIRCGRLVHLECSLSEELLEHIRTDHRFRVDSGRSILYGCCEDCVAGQAVAQEDGHGTEHGNGDSTGDDSARNM